MIFEIFKNQKKINARYYQRYITNVDETIIEFAEFAELSRFGDYKAKCILDNTALSIEEKDSFIFTLGTFEGVTKALTLMTSNNWIYANCMSLVFNSKYKDIEKN